MGAPVTEEFCGERHKSIEDKLANFADLRAQESTAQAAQGAAILEALHKLADEQRDLNDRMFRDNGRKSMQTLVTLNARAVASNQASIVEIRRCIDRFGWWIFSACVGSACVILVSHYAGMLGG